MSEQFVGCTVSVKCIEELGTYQGEIIDLNKNSIMLAKAFCNGIPQSAFVVSLNVKDIVNIAIISTKEAGSKVNFPKRPIAKKASKSISESAPPTMQATGTSVQSNMEKPADPVPQPPPMAEPSTNGRIGPMESNFKSLQKKQNHRQRALGRDEDTFGTPIDQSLKQDFDFEKNLALFNKEAVWEELYSLRPRIARQLEGNKGLTGNYRHDENVILSEPATFRQITVPSPGKTEYVTDNGLIIPTITLDLHRQLIGAADRFGITWERRVELFGRAGCEIILQLLGGGHRLHPNNAHQLPTVVALCGPHRTGAAGINCARQLSSHGVKTIVYVKSSEDVFLLQELSLYRLTENKVETDVKNLPSAVDLILVALCDENSPRKVTRIALWANSNKAPILAIEPPMGGTPGILTKFSLLGALPMSHSVDNGRLYLCNLALPNKVYSDVGITYRSPFGPKFVIPLHSNKS